MQQQLPHLPVYGLLVSFGDEGIYRLLNPDVGKLVLSREFIRQIRQVKLHQLVGSADGYDQTFCNRFPQVSHRFSGRLLIDSRQCLKVKLNPNTGSQLKHTLRPHLQFPDLAHQQFDDVVGHAPRLNLREIPLPKPTFMVKVYQLFSI